jgi:peptidyl-prolyl cis-trans isomerase B (cyclophilin B)
MSQFVQIETSAGTIRIELDTEKAPLSAQNFVDYVKAGHYDNTVFHRVIRGFMVQGGGFEPGMKQKSTQAPIQNEANNGLKNNKYTLAMARTSAPHSATAQFFINVANNEFLNHTAPSAQGWGYAVFGRVVDGTDVVDRIEGVKTGRKGFHDDVPLEDVVILRATLVD